MYILSQAGKNLISVDKVKRFFVEKNYGGNKEQKFAIFVELGTSNSMIGLYPTEEDAINALEEISIALEEGVEEVYRVPKKNNI